VSRGVTNDKSPFDRTVGRRAMVIFGRVASDEYSGRVSKIESVDADSIRVGKRRS
jgi:hypothetical protein